MSRRAGRGSSGERADRGPSAVGRRFTVDVGPVAHGGHCVARLPEEPGGSSTSDGAGGGRVVFVRHAVPGERVEVEVTEGAEGDRFWRADAVEVLSPSRDRVTPPCPYAGPGRCGGCDFQHVDLTRQRLLKGEVVREQLVRLAGLAPDDPLVAGLVVEPVPGDREGLRWRTRVQYAVDEAGRRGFRKHRSHEVVPVEDCRITRHDAVVREPGVRDRRTVVERVAPGDGGGREFAVDADGFWQAHVGAPPVLVQGVLDLLRPQPGESALDLYAGVGLFAAFLAERVGEQGRVTAVEASHRACRRARENLAGLPWADVLRGPVDRVLPDLDPATADVVVLDPPREGARARVVDRVAALAPRAVVHVACDPAALARDVALFSRRGYRLQSLRALDLFPMTHHVECLALFERA